MPVVDSVILSKRNAKDLRPMSNVGYKERNYCRMLTVKNIKCDMVGFSGVLFFQLTACFIRSFTEAMACDGTMLKKIFAALVAHPKA